MEVLANDHDSMENTIETEGSVEVLSKLTCNIVEYIAGYVVRSLEHKKTV